MTEFLCPLSNIQEVAHAELTIDGIRVRASGTNRLDYAQSCLLRRKLEQAKRGESIESSGVETCRRCNRIVEFDLKAPRD